jgi:hypothetical protein
MWNTGVVVLPTPTPPTGPLQEPFAWSDLLVLPSMLLWGNSYPINWQPCSSLKGSLNAFAAQGALWLQYLARGRGFDPLYRPRAV